MNAYEIRFTGRKTNAQGICQQHTAQRFALDSDKAIVALYDEFEHISQPEVKQIGSPFDAEGLELACNNDRATYDAILRHVNGLIHAVESRRDKLAQENKQWHDDPDSPEHWLYHSPADMQYPAAMVFKVVAELVLYQLRERPAGQEQFEKLTLKG